MSEIIKKKNSAATESNEAETLNPIAKNADETKGNLEPPRRCNACQMSIPHGAKVCPTCQTRQNKIWRFIQSGVGPASVALAAFALFVTLVANFVLYIDKYLCYRNESRPSVIATAVWSTEPTEASAVNPANTSTDLQRVRALVETFNDGFSPTKIIGYECEVVSTMYALEAGFFDSPKPGVGPLEVAAIVRFVPLEPVITEPSASRRVAFGGLDLRVSMVTNLDELDFTDFEGGEFVFSSEAHPVCRVQHFYDHRLWGLPTRLHSSWDALDYEGVLILESLIAERVSDILKSHMNTQ